MRDVLAGMVGGLAATVPMTAAMELMHQALPASEARPLPPRRIERRLTGAGGARRGLGEAEHVALTTLLHFGFGGAAGAVYGAASPHLPGPPIVKGAGFGLALWASAYLAGLPALGLERSALREPAGRNGLLLAAHVVWGAVLGALTERLRRERDEDTAATTATTRTEAREKALASVRRSQQRGVVALVRGARA